MNFSELEGIFHAVAQKAVSTIDSFSYLGTQTHFVHLPAVDTAILPVCDALGMSLTLIKYTLALFLVYPFSAVLYAIPNKNVKHFFSFAVGFFLMQWIYGPDWIHSFISSLGTYLICALFPSRSQHIVVFLWVMGYMTASHAYQMYNGYMSGVFDFTGTQMVLTMKLTSFAFNLFDGTADAKNVFPAAPHSDKRKAKVYQDRQRFAIRSLPNPLEFFGYVFCFTCLLAGPAFEYADYNRSIDGSAFQITSEPGGDQKLPSSSPPVQKRPSTLLPGLQRLLVAVLSLVLHLQVAGRFPIKSLYSKDFIASTSYLYRYLFMYMALLGDRLKYYFAWKVAEGASILGGFGFEGFDSQGKAKGWGGVENVNIVGCETAPNVQTLSRNWNKRTQGWLERYTYHRTGKSLNATYFVSAFWHGLYPGFFLFFMSVPLLTNVERLIKVKINPYIVPGYDGFDALTYPNTLLAKIYWVLCIAGQMLVMTDIVQVFSMGSLENSLIALGSFHFVPHIAMVLLYVTLEMLPTPGKKDKKKE